NAGHAENLGPEDLEAIGAAIAPTVSKPKPSDIQPSEPQPGIAIPEHIQELALWLAVRGQIVLLRSCMVHSLKESDPSAVIDLWHSYAKRALLGEGDTFLEELPHPAPHLPKPTTDTTQPAPTDDTTQQTLLPYYPGRPELLTLTICAYTMRSDFRSAFHTALATLIPLKAEQSREFLEPLIEIQETAVAHTLVAVGDINLLRMLARPWSFRRYIMDSVQTKSDRTVQRIWDHFVKLLRAPEPWISPLGESTGPPVVSTDPDARPLFSVSRQTWCDLIEAASALRPQLPSLTQSIWAELHTHDVKPTTGMWNALLSGYAMYGDFARAWAIWDEMGSEGRDAYTYTSMIQALFEWREPDKAVKLFDQLKSVSREKGEELDIRSYNIALHGLFLTSKLQSALDLLSHLESSSSSTTPDVTTYNIQLRHYARKRDMLQLSKALKGMAEREIEPDVYTFVTVLDALLGVGVKDAATRILEIMQALGVEPNAALVGALLEHVVSPVPPPSSSRQPKGQSTPEPAPPAERLQTGLKMLLEFERSGIETNVVNYTALMAAFQRAATHNVISHAEAQAAITALRERMRQRQIVPNRVTYNLLIKAALEGGKLHPSQFGQDPSPPPPPSKPKANNPYPIDLEKVPPNVSQAIKYFHELRGAGILPNHDTWYVLIRGVASWGEMRLASVLCDEMLETKFIPQTGLVRLVMKIKGERRRD
ncbi:hypothetical protein FRC09_014665, partial [Ceratobasidium sp. 395]